MQKLLLVGRIGKPHGLRGLVYVHAFNEDSAVWAEGERFAIVPVAAVGETPPDVVEAKPAGGATLRSVTRTPKDRLIMAFDEIGGPDDVERLRGAWLAVPLADVEAPAEDEFFHWEVVGWRVIGVDGADIGHVVRVVETYTEDLEVKPSQGGPTFFIPILKEIVHRIDREAKRFVVDLPEGLAP